MSLPFNFVCLRHKKRTSFKYTRLTLGTHSSCDLVIDDPIAATVAGCITFEGGGFVLGARPSSSGIYVGGRELDGSVRLAEGDEIVLGFCRLRCKSIDPLEPELQIEVLEKSFYYKAKVREEFDSESDQWARSEETFGRYRSLSLLNVVAFIGSLLILWAVTSSEPSRNTFLEPGPMMGQHAMLFAGADTASAQLIGDAIPMGCASCHGEDGTVSQERCLSCHQELDRPTAAAGSKPRVGRKHPFGALVSDEGNACLKCHQEHRGAEPVIHEREEWPLDKGCMGCHEGGDAEHQDLVELARAGASTDRQADTLAPGDVSLRSLANRSFDHPVHAALECAECHTQGADVSPELLGSGIAQAATSDWETVSFQSCNACHGSSGVAWTSELSVQDHTNVQQRCALCHGVDGSGAMRLVGGGERKAAALYQIQAYDHASVWSVSHSAGRDCTYCHKNPPAPILDAEPRAFPHDLHLNPAPARAMQQCVACHGNMDRSEQLGGEASLGNLPPMDSCRECHRDSEVVRIPQAAPVVSSGQQGRVQFNHARHLAGGLSCLDCHEVLEVRGDAGAPTLSKSCADCHLDVDEDGALAHANAGLDTCNRCHPGSGPERMAELFYGPPTAPSTAAGQSRFSHFSTVHNFGARERAGCQECHPATAKSPAMSAPSSRSHSACAECHNRMFHWWP